QKNLIGKAQSRPDLVKQVIEKAKKEGWLNTFKNVMSKMEKPMPLGYSASGTVHECMSGAYAGNAWMHDIKIGDRVAIAGAGYASHAEVNSVPKNLCAKIPDEVGFEEAAYTTVASIALQGVRLAKPELGDYVAVSGLGLIGLIAVQLFKANGCRVFGIDPDQTKLDLAFKLGMDAGINLNENNIPGAVENFTRGRLADYTFIAAASKNSQPIELAGEITRRKGKVIAVGAVGMNIPRDVYYKKELELKISMSYGPGRYDSSYEEGGIDYPYDYVRWTEQRNMEAVLELMAGKKLDVKSLTTHRIKFENAIEAYDLIKENKEPYIGILLEYDQTKDYENTIQIKNNKSEIRTPKSDLSAEASAKAEIVVGFAGAGNYASLHLLPHLKKNKKVKLEGLVTSTGLNSKQKGEKFGFEFCSTDFESIIKDDSIDSVFIATRHSTHAEYVIKALRAGKKVFVEKPLCVNESELEEIINSYHSVIQPFPANGAGSHSVPLMVGLNRRFALMTKIMKEFIGPSGPMQMAYRVNSGSIPPTGWLHNPEEGGGMLIGEMCHFADLMQFIAGEKPVAVFAASLNTNNANICSPDNISITIKFDKGSVGVLNYNTLGDKSFSKERLEVFAGGKAAVLDDFRRLELISSGKKIIKKSVNQDKGQPEQIAETIEAFRQNISPISFEDIINGMRIIFAAKKSLSISAPVQINS
ncbi:MAG: bi-domain-containing oxidoreductase, partial [Ignavibacteria bacterium]